ncbi:MAG: hypothetical protein Q8P57_00575 [Candidatus Pacearchaeota archaeon]|nr:hypothetical protein [Candidatus Pacearchaeota archaeon]
MDTKQRSEKGLSQFIFLPQGVTKANVVESHSIPSGAFEQALYRAVSKRINASVEQGGFGGNEAPSRSRAAGYLDESRKS